MLMQICLLHGIIGGMKSQEFYGRSFIYAQNVHI